MPNMNQHFSLRIRAEKDGDKGEIMVFSVIDTWKWGDNDPTVTSNDINKQLKALGDVKEITVRINSPGGVVSEAVAIRTALMKHKAKKTIDIEGCCDSAATLIACLPGAKVRMAKGGEYMIHRSSWGAYGHADDLLSAYNSLRQTDKDIADIYAERTGKTSEECMALMEAETWYGAQEALENGFVDEIIGGEEEMPMVACAVSKESWALMQQCYSKAPAHDIRDDAPDEEGNHEPKAVAEGSTCNKNSKGEEGMDENKNATAEATEQVTPDPDWEKTVTERAIKAERERIREIDELTPPGAEYEEMAREAKENGTEAATFFKQILAKQRQKGREFLEARKTETKQSDKVDGGDSTDQDNAQARMDKDARDIAEFAKNMSETSYEMC